MADTATSVLPMAADPAPKKKGRSRKALQEKNPSTNEANILAGSLTDAAQSPEPATESDPSKENHESISHPRSEKKQSKKSKGKQAKEPSSNFEKDLQEMQDMLEKLKIEKEKTEEMLKEKDLILKKKEEEIETRDREQQKLQTELKKLQKMKEFKPIMNLPMTQSLKEKELEKKDKKKKDCPERKRPASAYALWCKDQWSEIKREKPEADFKEISNIMGAKWKNLSPEDKKPYEEKYQAEKETYLQITGKEKRETEAMKLLEEDQKQRTAMELLDQYLQFKQEADKDTKKTKKEKDPSKPKQPISAFFLYSKERRAGLLEEGKNLLEASKVIGQEWKSMTEEQKIPYEEIAKENKDKYQKEMEVYKQKKEEESASLKKEEEELMKIHKVEALQLLKKKEKTDNIIKKTKDMKKKKQKEVDPNKPKRPASSFLLFSKEERKNVLQERPDINNSTINALISLKWKELSEHERKMWNEKAAGSWEAYKKELEEYNNNKV